MLREWQVMERRFTFDQVADIYSTVRPAYPESLVDDVLSFAALARDDAILEIGCGTGQATRSFAARGFPMFAIDPGAEMLRAACASLVEFANIEFAQATFETWSGKPASFRLIIAAQSWHWIEPQLRYVKAAELLSPSGSLAVFGHVPVGLPAALREPFRQAFLRHVGAWGRPPEAWYLPDGPFEKWFDESGLFGPVEHRSYPWQWRHNASSYVDFLRTRSDLRMLGAATREALLEEIAVAIGDHGGTFEVDYQTHLYIARCVHRH
jgi:SAM-dependent methyltransferase